ncbi:MAG TPA: hypothetical protein VF846_21285 [Thermoanaerobaculia bacterium]|jgi:hypothetical protein
MPLSCAPLLVSLLTVRLLIGAAFAAELEPVVLHAEAPARGPLAMAFPAKVLVEVDVAPDGTVAAARVPTPVAFVSALSIAAACKWRFASSADSAQRHYVLTFVYGGIVDTEEPSQWRIERQDNLALRIEYLRSTIRRLERDRDGRIPEQFCPRHGTLMQVALAPVAYGLLASYSDSTASQRAELRRAESVRRARERHFPHANMWAPGGGCIVGPEKQAEVYYCPTCRNAREKWFAEHVGFQKYE